MMPTLFGRILARRILARRILARRILARRILARRILAHRLPLVTRVTIQARHLFSGQFVFWRLLIIFGVLALAAGFGFASARFDGMILIALAALPFLVLGIEYILTHFEMTPVVILIVAAFVPFSLPTGTASRLVLSLVLTTLFIGIWLIRMFIIEKRFSLLASPINLPLLSFIAAVLISLGWSNLFRDPLVRIWSSYPFVQVASTLVMVMLPGAFLLLANHVRDERPLKWMVVIMIIAGCVGLISFYARVRLPINPNGLFNMWVIALTSALAVFNTRLSIWLRGLMLAITLAWLRWNFGLHIVWLTGWLPGFMALGVLAFMRSKKMVILFGLILLIIIASNPSYYLGSVIETEADQSGSTRLAAWVVNWRITKNHLLFGTGPAGYAAYYMSYFPTEAMATHNNYLDILAQTGFIGLGLCLWFFVVLLWHGYRVAMRLKGRGDFLEALAMACLAGTAGCIFMMAFGDWLFPFAYTQTIAGFDYAVYNWLFMGVIPVLDRLSRPAGNSPVSSPRVVTSPSTANF